MGRLSEYINGYSGSRPSYGWKGSQRGSVVGSAHVEVQGYEDTVRLIDSLLSSSPTMDKAVRKLIDVATKEARKRVTESLGQTMDNDPRLAQRAVKYMIYKRLFGSNLSILARRRASKTRATLNKVRKVELNPHMRGGNRRPYKQERNRLDQYYGADRGFILRFLSSGTDNRETRFGNRESIRGTDMFGRIAPWHLEQAVKDIHDAIAEYIDGMKA